MKVGVHLPQWGTEANRSGVLEVARAAERSGLDSIWAADHIVYPIESTSVYPYRAEGTSFGPHDGFLEAVTLLGVAAGATERIELGTSVLVMPMREVVFTAKSLATLDLLSGGRLITAMGIGWWEEEYRALSAPFAARGRRFDEQLDILRELWGSGLASHDGEFYHFDKLACLPLPAQRGGPPVWIGGLSEAALRRAALRGDGWHAVGADRQALVTGRETILRFAAEHSRELAGFSISTSTGSGRNPERLLRRLTGYRDAGVSHVVLNLPDGSLNEQLDLIESIGETVLLALR